MSIAPEVTGEPIVTHFETHVGEAHMRQEQYRAPLGPVCAYCAAQRVMARIQQKEDSMTTTTDLTIRPFEVHMPDEDLARS